MFRTPVFSYTIIIPRQTSNYDIFGFGNLLHFFSLGKSGLFFFLVVAFSLLIGWRVSPITILSGKSNPESRQPGHQGKSFLNIHFPLQQSTETITLTETQTLTITATPSATNLGTPGTATLSTTPTSTVSPTRTTTPAFASPTMTSLASITSTSNSSLLPALTSTVIIDFSPQSSLTSSIVASPTLVPLPKTIPATPTQQLLSLQHPRGGSGPSKAVSTPLATKLARFWTLGAIFLIWLLLAGWFIFTHKYLD